MSQREFVELQRDKINIAVRRAENREATINDYPVEYQNPDQLVGDGTDWYDLLLQTALVRDHNISVSKGSKESRINFSLGYFEQEGTVRYTGVRRYSSKLGMESGIGKAVTVGASLQPAFIEQDRTNTNANREDILGVANWANHFLVDCGYRHILDRLLIDGRHRARHIFRTQRSIAYHDYFA